MRRGAAHVGMRALQFLRMRLSVQGDGANRQALLAGTCAGGLLLLAPLWDDGMYRRLASLHVRSLLVPAYAACVCCVVNVRYVYMHVATRKFDYLML